MCPCGAVTVGTLAFGGVTLGGDTWGAPPPEGVETDGVVAFGAVADGTVTLGVVTTGVLTGGTDTVGVLTVGVVTAGTFSAGALAASAIVATTVIAKTAAIRLPWTIQESSYLDARMPKPGNGQSSLREAERSARDLSGLRGHQLRVLGVLPCAAPPVDRQRVAEPLVEQRLERVSGRQRLSNPPHEEDASCDQLLTLVRRDIWGDVPDGLAHVGLDVLHVAFRIRLGEHTGHGLELTPGLGRELGRILVRLLHAVSKVPCRASLETSNSATGTCAFRRTLA